MSLSAFHSIRRLLARRLLAVTALALLAAGSTAFAEDDPADQAGRLSSVSGTVSVQQAGSNDWGQAALNLPLGPGDRVYTDADGRAEIQVGESYLRLGPNSDVTFVEFTPGAISFGIAQGTVHLRTLGLWNGQSLNIDTPNGSATLAQPGELRLDVLTQNDASIFTSFSDDALLSGAGGFAQHITNGQSLELSGTNPVETQWLQPAYPDALDNWSRARDAQIARAASYRFVSPEIPGAAELDGYGEWNPDTEYGAVWFPTRVGPGWAPYHYGHWVNHEPWGWVWVEDEPWGYAPFHYGRWVSLRGRWGWVPGPREAHPVWSPALVAFAGGIQVGGTGVSVWFPLGPGEPYRPWYRCSPRYIDRINITNIRETRIVHVQRTYVNVVNVTYVNRNIGVMAMRHDDFAAGRPAYRTPVVIDRRQLDHVRVLDRPEPRPGPRSFGFAPPARPVPVRPDRPLLINPRGQQVAARPGAPAMEPPRRMPPAFRPVPGRTVIAPPPNATGHHSFPGPGNQPGNGMRQHGNTPENGQPGRPGMQPPANNVPQQPFNRPNANQPPQQRPVQPPADNPRQPFARPNPAPAQPPASRPVQPPANSTPQQPFNRPNTNQPPPQRPVQPPAESPRPVPPFARPNPAPAQPPANNAPQQPFNRPNANQPPQQRPVQPPADSPRQGPPFARPYPAPAQPPAPRPAQPPANNAPQQPFNRPNANQPQPQRPSGPPPSAQPAPRPANPPNAKPAPAPKQEHPQKDDKKPEK